MLANGYLTVALGDFHSQQQCSWSTVRHAKLVRRELILQIFNHARCLASQCAVVHVYTQQCIYMLARSHTLHAGSLLSATNPISLMPLASVFAKLRGLWRSPYKLFLSFITSRLILDDASCCLANIHFFFDFALKECSKNVDGRY